jgi:hypothetical protein
MAGIGCCHFPTAEIIIVVPSNSGISNKKKIKGTNSFIFFHDLRLYNDVAPTHL